MSVKAIFIFCAILQSVFSQCTSRAATDASGPYGYSGYGIAAPAYGPALAYDEYAAPCGYGAGRLAYNGIYPGVAAALDFTPTSGGALPVSSASAYAPIGLSIISENSYEGLLAVSGELPFVGTTSLDGVVPSAGAGAINHACGNGLNAMSALSASSSPASVATSAFPASYGIAAPAYASAAYSAPALAASGYAPAFAASGYAAPGFAASGYAAPAFAAPAIAASALAYDAPFSAAYPYECLGYADGIEFTATSGGALPVSSASAIPPTGISVASETVYEGPLAVAGELPFVGTVGLEGVLPTAGAGAINHACGNGINAMSSAAEAFAPTYGSYGAYAPAAAIAPGYAAPGLAGPAFGYNAGFAGRGCGYAY